MDKALQRSLVGRDKRLEFISVVVAAFHEDEGVFIGEQHRRIDRFIAQIVPVSRAEGQVHRCFVAGRAPRGSHGGSNICASRRSSATEFPRTQAEQRAVGHGYCVKHRAVGRIQGI